jgi:hypothetical protein
VATTKNNMLTSPRAFEKSQNHPATCKGFMVVRCRFLEILSYNFFKICLSVSNSPLFFVSNPWVLIFSEKSSQIQIIVRAICSKNLPFRVITVILIGSSPPFPKARLYTLLAIDLLCWNADILGASSSHETHLYYICF